MTAVSPKISYEQYSYTVGVNKTADLCAELRATYPHEFPTLYPIPGTCIITIPVNTNYNLVVYIAHNTAHNVTANTLYWFDAHLQHPTCATKLSESTIGYMPTANTIHSIYTYWRTLFSRPYTNY